MSRPARTRVLTVLLGAVVVVSGCAAGDDESAASSTTIRDRETTMALSDDTQRLPERVPSEALEPSTVTGEVPAELLDPVVADAAERSGIDPANVVVVTDQAMLWADGSLGCAEPGQFYTQAQVQGYWVVVEAGGAAYDYRLDDRGFFRLCTSPLPGPGDSSPTS